MKIRVIDNTEYPIGAVSVRCPHCGREAVLDGINKNDVQVNSNYKCGQRRCPNPDCRGHLFIVLYLGDLVASYPPIKLDFDASNIPEKIKNTFEEALTCHSAGCFVASAIMVRRTLEEICVDKSAVGANLKLRLKDLRSKIVLPDELIEAMDELRLLGNDAAHIEAKDYNKISSDELEVAIEVTKEIMKGLYQYSNLLGKLKALKGTGTP